MTTDLFVDFCDDPVCEDSTRGLVNLDRLVPGVAADPALAAVLVVLDPEAPAVALVVVLDEVRGFLSNQVRIKQIPCPNYA